MDLDSEIQGYNVYPMLHFYRKFSSGITPSSRALLEEKSVGNLIQGTWASVYEVYVAVVAATTLLLKLGA